MDTHAPSLAARTVDTRLTRSLAVIGLVLLAPAVAAHAQLTETELFFELNNTDGDLGIHTALDGAGWRDLTIFDTGNRQMLDINVKGRLRNQGLTQLSFESTEPLFEDLAPKDFFERFPEGTYLIQTRNLAGAKSAHETELTHAMPAPPSNLSVNGMPLPADCDEATAPMISGAADIILMWDPVTTTHPDLGSPRGSMEIDIAQYQAFVDQDDFSLAVDRDPGTTSVTIPAGTLSAGLTLVEVLVREDSHNQTATETCFETIP